MGGWAWLQATTAVMGVVGRIMLNLSFRDTSPQRTGDLHQRRGTCVVLLPLLLLPHSMS